MKFLKSVTAILSLLSLASPLQAAETLVLDDQHTFVLWSVNHFGFSNQSGKWYASGSLTLDKDKPQISQVEANIDVASITTGLPELDKHLKSKEFFDVTRFPTATYKSTSVEVTGEKSANVQGQLTLHGVTKPVTLKVTLNGTGVNPIYDRKTVGFSATAHIKRSDFGIKTFLPMIGDEVTLDIQAEAYQPKK